MRMLENIKFILMPHYWNMKFRYSRKWDKELNELMEKYEFKPIYHHGNFKGFIDGYSCMLGEKEIWFRNHPFSSFTLYHGETRPSRSTIYKARRKFMNEIGDLYANLD